MTLPKLHEIYTHITSQPYTQRIACILLSCLSNHLPTAANPLEMALVKCIVIAHRKKIQEKKTFSSQKQNIILLPFLSLVDRARNK